MSDAIREALEALDELVEMAVQHHGQARAANEYRDTVKAALQSQTAPAVPEGWALVPIEPTQDMLARAVPAAVALVDQGPEKNEQARTQAELHAGIRRREVAAHYRTMLAAAPQPDHHRKVDPETEAVIREAVTAGRIVDGREPAHSPDAGKVVAELDRIRGLIAQATIDSLGTGHNDGSCPPWPIRDEVVDGLSKAIRTLSAAPSVPENEVKAQALEEEAEKFEHLANEADWRPSAEQYRHTAAILRKDAARLRASQQEGG